MGLLEVQVPARASPAGATLVGPCCTASVESVCPLAAASGAWLDKGSRMSREAHVRFCESGGVRFPSATHRVILVDAYARHDWLLQAVNQRLREELAKLRVDINEEKSRFVDLAKGE